MSEILERRNVRVEKMADRCVQTSVALQGCVSKRDSTDMYLTHTFLSVDADFSVSLNYLLFILDNSNDNVHC